MQLDQQQQQQQQQLKHAAADAADSGVAVAAVIQTPATRKLPAAAVELAAPASLVAVVEAVAVEAVLLLLAVQPTLSRALVAIATYAAAPPIAPWHRPIIAAGEEASLAPALGMAMRPVCSLVPPGFNAKSI